VKVKNKIIVSQEREVFLYDTKLLRKEWSLEIKHKIAGVARFDNLVLISSYNWWGKVFSKFINFSSGETVLDIDENILSLLIYEDKLYFINKDKEIGCYSTIRKTKIFKVTSVGLWSWDGTPPKIALIDKSIFAFSKRKAYKINLSNGEQSEAKLPKGLDNKSITALVDEFQININTFSSSPSGDSGFIAGDMGGGDAGGGDAGGGDGGG
tara:strand:+ start:878 stop:1507 length:630 start_codon:yes stop_codon:yes gene_type:complete